MEKSSSIVLSEHEKALVRGGEIPERFLGWYSLEELKEYV
jgi:hypothetical protein